MPSSYKPDMNVSSTIMLTGNLEPQPNLQRTTYKEDQRTDKPQRYPRDQDAIQIQTEQPERSSGSIRVNSIEEVDQMTDEEVKIARLSGASKKRLIYLINSGRNYIEAKRTVIKDNLVKSQKSQAEAINLITRNKVQKRLRDQSDIILQRQEKRANFDELALTQENIAVVQDTFPTQALHWDKLKTVQKSIMEAYEMIPPDGPQVRFVKSTHRPGYLVVTCADATSAAWLKEIIPKLEPWEGARLRTLVGEEIPGVYTCSVYVPDEDGIRLNADRILNRLRVGNQGLYTVLWSVFGKTASERGQLWTFSVDKRSMEELQKLEMCPYFGMGRIQFRPGKDSAQ